MEFLEIIYGLLLAAYILFDAVIPIAALAVSGVVALAAAVFRGMRWVVDSIRQAVARRWKSDSEPD